MRSDQRKLYIGPTHEFLDCAPDHCIPRDAAYFDDHADGANRPNKYKNDIRLLKAAYKEEKSEALRARYAYYLGQSYRDAGDNEKAAKWYKRCVELNQWDQERWHAQYCYAMCQKSLDNEDGFVNGLLTAYYMRPSRSEPLYDLANYYRCKGWNFNAAMISHMAMMIPPSGDQLFVNDYIEKIGNAGEFAITGYYVPWMRHAAAKVNNRLVLDGGPYRDVPETARQNSYHYVRSLKDYCPSFDWKKIDFEAPEGYTAMNPSIASWYGFEGTSSLYHEAMLIRTVNYTMDEHGRYLIKGTDGTANAQNPIHTRTFFVQDGFPPCEIQLPVDWPKEPLYPWVIGWEDMRLYRYADDWWVSATVRERSEHGFARQYRGRLGPAGQDAWGLVIVDWVEMKPQTNYEKNWMPIQNDEHQFMYRVNEVVDATGETVTKTSLPIDAGFLCGGSQVIRVNDQWIGLVHEARNIPGQPTRWYAHRFAAWDGKFMLTKLSQAFYMHDRHIEYAAGLALGADGLTISYGYKDCEARLATVKVEEVEKFLWQS